MTKDTMGNSTELHSSSGVGKLISWNERYECDIQSDGNLVVYSIPKVSGEKRRVIWASDSNAKHPSGDYKLSMQSDGNLVVYHNNDPKWSSNTCDKKTHRKGPYHCTLYDSGSLKVFDHNNDCMWSSPIDNHIKTK